MDIGEQNEEDLSSVGLLVEVDELEEERVIVQIVCQGHCEQVIETVLHVCQLNFADVRAGRLSEDGSHCDIQRVSRTDEQLFVIVMLELDDNVRKCTPGTCFVRV